MCGRTIDITLPLVAQRLDGGPALGPVVQWLDTNGTPEVWQTSAKAARAPDSETILARAVKWAACWGPSAWYFRGISFGNTSEPDEAFENSAFMVLGSEPPSTPQLSVLWVGLPVYYGAPDAASVQPVTATGGSTNPAGWSRTPLPRMWWILPPEIVSSGRLFVAHLELAALTDREEPVSLVFTP